LKRVIQIPKVCLPERDKLTQLTKVNKIIEESKNLIDFIDKFYGSLFALVA